MGSGRKPDGEKFVGWMFRMPLALLRRFQRAVPDQHRSEFMREALEAALEREGLEPARQPPPAGEAGSEQR